MLSPFQWLWDSFFPFVIRVKRTCNRRKGGHGAKNGRGWYRCKHFKELQNINNSLLTFGDKKVTIYLQAKQHPKVAKPQKCYSHIFHVFFSSFLWNPRPTLRAGGSFFVFLAKCDWTIEKYNIICYIIYSVIHHSPFLGMGQSPTAKAKEVCAWQSIRERRCWTPLCWPL